MKYEKLPHMLFCGSMRKSHRNPVRVIKGTRVYISPVTIETRCALTALAAALGGAAPEQITVSSWPEGPSSAEQNTAQHCGIRQRPMPANTSLQAPSIHHGPPPSMRHAGIHAAHNSASAANVCSASPLDVLAP